MWELMTGHRSGWWYCWGMVLLVASSGGVVAGDEISNVISNIRSNEVLYENLEVGLREMYSIGNRTPATVSGTGRLEIVQQLTETRFVSKGGMFRADVSEEVQTSKSARKESRRAAFDGEFTRIVRSDEIGNIVKGMRNDPSKIMPHMLLLKNNDLLVPLSTYLSGGVAIRSHPDGDWPANKSLEVQYQGEVEHESLKCRRLVAVESIDGSPHNSWELWLAEARNDIPVKMLAYTFRVSKEIPVGEGTVTDWKEVEPGVWFPMTAKVVCYDKDVVFTKREQRIRWQIDYHMEDVSTSPKHEKPFFQDVVFPHGTGVYEIEGGKIVKRYRVGAPASPSGPERSVWKHWWFVGMNGIGVACLASVAIFRTYRNRAAGRSSGTNESGDNVANRPAV